MTPAFDGLSLEDKAARLCWVTVYGPAADAPHPGNRRAFGVGTPAEAIRRHRPGGVVLFGWAGNTEHPAQVAELTAQLSAAAEAEAGGAEGARLGVAIDEEGGRVSRLGPSATAFPGARAVAAAGDPDLALRRWRAAAAELAAVGVTTNLAPVVDLGHPRNPVLADRTFADDPETVAAQAALAVRGLHAGGVAAVAKHFPGHGATAVDSHETLPVVDLASAELEPHLDAFRRLLASAPPAGIMTAHLLVRAVDAEQPATLSPAVLGGLLRDGLGYTGPVVTDSLSMAALRAHHGDEVAVAALAAGADVLLLPPDLPGAVAAVCRAVRRGRLAEERVDEALRRGQALLRIPPAEPERSAAGAPPSPASVAARGVGDPGHRDLALAIARRAATVAADPHGCLPLGDRPVVVAGMVGSGARALADNLRGHGRQATLVELPLADPAGRRLDAAGQADDPSPGPWGADAEQQPVDLSRLVAAGDVAILLVRRAPELDAATQDAVLAPAAGGRRTVLVETGSAAATWPAARGAAVLLTRGAAGPSLDAAAELLVGADRSR